MERYEINAQEIFDFMSSAVTPLTEEEALKIGVEMDTMGITLETATVKQLNDLIEQFAS